MSRHADRRHGDARPRAPGPDGADRALRRPRDADRDPGQRGARRVARQLRVPPADPGQVRLRAGGGRRPRPGAAVDPRQPHRADHDRPAGPAGRAGGRRARAGSGSSAGSTGPGEPTARATRCPAGRRRRAGRQPTSSSRRRRPPGSGTRCAGCSAATKDRLADPALRPEGALPVEWTIFAAPVPELAAAGPTGPRRPATRPTARTTARHDSRRDPSITRYILIRSSKRDTS